MFRAFLFKHLFSFLVGATLDDWLKLLARQRFAVDPCYWPRAALVTLGTTLASIAARRERQRLDGRLDDVEVLPPLFILGHWRHGTTHLHNLLALDERLAFPRPYDVCHPHSVLCDEGASSRMTGLLIPKRRLQDNIRLSMEDPQEDETALCLATFLSPFMSWVFPRQAGHFDRYLTFAEAPPEEIAAWKAAFRTFMRKLTLKYGRPIVLKSPPHTCRIRLLLELFPDARFVHIRRHPYRVFQSTRHLEKTAILGMHLQRPDWRRLDERILKRYNVMYDAFFAEQPLVPPGRYAELSFEDLERDPMGQLGLLYERLSLPRFDEVQGRLTAYLQSLRGFRKNRLAGLDAETRRRVHREWSRSFELWGYDAGEGIVQS